MTYEVVPTLTSLQNLALHEAAIAQIRSGEAASDLVCTVDTLGPIG